MTNTSVPNQLAVALVDRYVLERELGRGGMATVYLARDVKHNRPVALKVLDPELGAVQIRSFGRTLPWPDVPSFRRVRTAGLWSLREKRIPASQTDARRDGLNAH